jgi:nucleoside-diphosphate-sugar epimerase
MTEQRKVLVTGAGGFIGGRAVEVLHATGHWRVAGGVRRWSSAARIGRFPVEIALCDVTSPASVRRAMAGVSHVVHCAVGGREVTVDGTRNVLQAAREAGVRRLVHVSTIDVYGSDAGELLESQPLRRTGALYGDTKIEAEEACLAAAAAGLPLTILRPSIVYGPFSKLWIVEFAQRLQRRPWPLPRELAGGICNAVYVDDVIQGVLLGLEHPGAVGEAFNINGAEWPTWFDYFTALNEHMGLPPIAAESPALASLHAWVTKPVRDAAKFALRRFQPQIMALYQRSSRAKRAMRRTEAMLRAAPTPGEFRLYSRTATYPTTKAQRVLGYRPRFPLDDGLRLSAAWLRHHGFILSGHERPVT